ncbi:outer membrane beta-barrel protein [Dyadobacter aurulentus]|uniref:outer membrane beta-barrel protein n=1 Tax=Dyadobacter sp. UC 10 TaxID=2605428 RepID=UPI0011F25ADA|nr:outer membrane beta-barrel protein [Dyadobacter sp. UC 10]KAA0990122.1 outer membrane beta-barrel protein [Dyadobacter sp. UC 10]
MKTISKFLIILLFTNRLFAQSPTHSISGNVKNTGNEVLPGVTVRILRMPDSVFVKGEITDIGGQFQINALENGTYLLDISAIGQKRFVSLPMTLDSVHRSIVLPAIILLPAKDIALKEVTVKAKRPLIEQEIDRTIVNVESMISSATSNTLEVLEKTPGVSVNINGEISLNGKNGVLVLIDGRSTYMSGADLAAYLKSLPGGLLDKIELIDNPSAKYDAAGNAVIDIKLKKNRVGGLTGSFSVGMSQGRYARSNGALNLNYSHKKVNLFANLGYGYEKNYSEDIFDRRFYNESSNLISSVDLTNDQVYKNKSINANFGLDFAATAKTTYGLIFNLNKAKRDGVFEYESKNYDAAHQLVVMGSGSTIGGDKRANTGINFNMLHKFNTGGRELSMDINYLNYGNNGNQLLRNQTFEPGGEFSDQENFRYRVPSDIHIYTAKADYAHPLKNNARFESGFKSSLIRTDNVFNYYDVEDGAETLNNTQSNHFKYNENINAAYLNGQKSWKKFGIQLGLRVENTNIEGNQLGNAAVTGSTFAKHYTGLFPSGYLSFKPDEKGNNTLGLMAVRRISRPNYQLLNPFLFLRDQYTYSTGNPDLNPQYQSRLELKYQRKQWLNMGLSYNKFKNTLIPITQIIDTVFVNKPGNVAGGFMVLLNTTVSASLTKWWYTNTTLRLSRIGLKGEAFNSAIDFKTNIARLEVNNYFTLGKTVSAELGGYYASRDFTAQTVTGGMYRVNASIQKKLWEGKGSIRISAEDIFHSWVYHNRSIALINSENFQTNRTDTQRIGAAFTYRFGKDTFVRKRRHNNNASDEEKERL